MEDPIQYGKKENEQNNDTYSLYNFDNELFLTRNKFPRFNAKVLIENEISLEDLTILDEAEADKILSSIKKGIEFIRKRYLKR